MVAIIGLGNMGGGMLRRLISQGEPVLAWDLDAGKRAEAAAAGATLATSLETCIAPVVIFSLPHAGAVASTLVKLYAALPAGSTIIDTSTLDAGFVRNAAEGLLPRGIHYLDAPVSGGPAGALAGTLTMMLGAEPAALEAVRPLLEKLCARIVHVGPSGAGQVAKLVNNLMVATHLVVSAEALRLGAKAGVPAEALLPVINAASGRSAATEVNWPRWITSGSFDSGFSAGLMRKDVKLAMDLAEGLELELPTCAQAAARWLQSRETVKDTDDFNRLPFAIAND